MRILIIGSKGFIGSHCVKHFSKAHECWGCDITEDDSATNYFVIDSTNKSIEAVLKNNAFDVCINCSGAASVPDSVIDPLKDYTLNTFNVFNQLNAIRLHNPDCKYINLSSAAVYGNPQCLPISEDMESKPISPYGKHKKMAEDISREFYEIYGIQTCAVRIFSAFGEGLKKQLFWDLYTKSKKREEIILHGTGHESRDYIYIAEIISQLECIINRAAFKGECVNIASGVETTIADAVAIFYKLLPWTGEVIYNGIIRPGDPLNWCADISKIKDMGYTPKMALEEGLKSYIQWVKEQ